MTRVADTHVPDADFNSAAAVFGEKELADLTIAISLMNAYNRLAIAFRPAPDSTLAAGFLADLSVRHEGGGIEDGVMFGESRGMPSPCD
ncbi:hypothetical protein Rmet_5742 (plasmid) [Cupriavidus metallidurans CH34]|uniref:Uncharacterized protein n=1 Tax=Cupriavidus metallidurans (strain ATCC 43123 / DSM 2839 / NBRC 102507 / CH34) TaxID=266264 RepID=Q1LB75_CUPMC|nr:hypothetical protein Rmet_5742 [Cupriavidus metallidurans CH34]